MFFMFHDLGTLIILKIIIKFHHEITEDIKILLLSDFIFNNIVFQILVYPTYSTRICRINYF